METVQARFDAQLKSIGVQPTQLELDRKGTLVTLSPGTAPSGSAGGPASALTRARLPVLRTTDAQDAPADVRITALLGEGGMGKVMAAEQVALGRQVAVKVLRDEPPDPKRVVELLREAVVAGRLEHPNIVPVYLLGTTDQGAPLFVMRRIEGVPWSDVLRDPSTVPAFFGAEARDTLQFALTIFSRVCEAVHFAHSRGIVHRDLKPDNVMLGTYGEVYVVDWGLAVSLRDDPQIPHAKAARGLAGTPRYMAPEMAAPSFGTISERSDVFLLGAILHEVVTGDGPNDAPTVYEQLLKAFDAAPIVYPDNVPNELAEICLRAMRREPDERYASVDELRRAVGEFLLHRGSWTLAREADLRAQALRDALSGDARSEALNAQKAHDRAQELFTECRFGYLQALRAWPDNQAAKDGLQAAVEEMIAHELSRGNPGHASALLQQLLVPRPELEARVAQALRKAELNAERLQELETFRTEADTTISLDERARALAGIAIFWFLLVEVFAYLDYARIVPFSYRGAIASIALNSALTTAAAMYILRVRKPSAALRHLLYATIAMGVGMVSQWVFSWALEIPLRVALPQFLWWVAGGWILAGMLVDRRIAVTGIGFGATSIALVLWPNHQLFVFGLGCLVSFGGLAVAWWPRERRKNDADQGTARSSA